MNVPPREVCELQLVAQVSEREVAHDLRDLPLRKRCGIVHDRNSQGSAKVDRKADGHRGVLPRLVTRVVPIEIRKIDQQSGRFENDDFEEAHRSRFLRQRSQPSVGSLARDRQGNHARDRGSVNRGERLNLDHLGGRLLERRAVLGRDRGRRDASGGAFAQDPLDIRYLYATG